MRIGIIQHVQFEGPGNISRWIEANGHEQEILSPDAEDQFHFNGRYDGLVILGGPMGVYAEAEYPWLITEKRFLGQYLETGRPVLGICLGAQLLAEILGARIVRNAETEIGFFPVNKTRSADNSRIISGLPRQISVLHWHSDTFTVPAQAARIMESTATANQAFEFRKNVVALQFHLETDFKGLENLLRYNVEQWTSGGKYVQNREQMEAAFDKEKERLRRYLYEVLDTLFGGRKPRKPGANVVIQRKKHP